MMQSGALADSQYRLGAGVDAGAGDAYHWPEGADGELGRRLGLEAKEAAELPDWLCLL